MAKYFSMDELTASSKAVELNMNNTPDRLTKCHIEELMSVLDVLREGWGSPIIVTSGYRCPELNKAVGGSKTSVHMTGYAADLKPRNGEMKKFIEWLKQFVVDNNLKFDQIINEYPQPDGTPSWVHFGLRNNKGQQRMMNFKYEG